MPSPPRIHRQVASRRVQVRLRRLLGPSPSLPSHGCKLKVAICWWLHKLPHAILARCFTAKKKRNRCSKKIPPLVHSRLEDRLDPEVMNLVGLFVDSQCRYDGELPFLNEPIWSYPERGQEEDFSTVCNAASSVLYYYASE